MKNDLVYPSKNRTIRFFCFCFLLISTSNVLSATDCEFHKRLIESWVERAKAGDSVAQHVLGKTYLSEDTNFIIKVCDWWQRDYKRKPAEALRWLNKAIDQGSINAITTLAFQYSTGRDGVVLQDYARARELYLIAAKKGDGMAQSNMGKIHYNGWGVSKNLVLAHMWWNLSTLDESESWRDLGRRHRKLAEEQMTSQQVLKAQVLARKCVETEYQQCPG